MSREVSLGCKSHGACIHGTFEGTCMCFHVFAFGKQSSVRSMIKDLQDTVIKHTLAVQDVGIPSGSVYIEVKRRWLPQKMRDAAQFLMR